MPSYIDPIYRDGTFFEKSSGEKDAEYKVDQLKLLLSRNLPALPANIRLVADVGCGTGRTTYLLRDMIFNLGFSTVSLHGYDVHPELANSLGDEGVQFIAADFCAAAKEIYDLAVLLDVIEHVPDPIDFLHSVAQSARTLVLHIPLDDAWLSWIRNLPRTNLSHPGHLLILDAAAALNLLAYSGLRVIDFAYSPVFRAPSGVSSGRQRLLNPIRKLFYSISPYLAQKLFGGVSLMVLARSPRYL